MLSCQLIIMGIMPCCQTKEVKDTDLESKVRNSSIMKKPPVDQGQNRKTMLSEASKSKKADNFVILEEYPDYSSEEEEWNKIKIRASNE